MSYYYTHFVSPVAHADFGIIELTPGAKFDIIWQTRSDLSGIPWTMQMLPINTGYGHGDPIDLFDAVQASQDDSTPINFTLSRQNLTEHRRFSYRWMVPQTMSTLSGLYRLYTSESGLETGSASNASGTSCLISFVEPKTGPSYTDPSPQVLKLGDAIGLVFLSTILLAACAISLFYTTRDMLGTKQIRNTAKRKPIDHLLRPLKLGPNADPRTKDFKVGNPVVSVLVKEK